MKMSTKKIKENSEINSKDFYEKELERVNSWLAFAEAKNGALIAANIGLLGFVYNFCDKHPIISTIALAILTGATIISLLSFFPIFNNIKNKTKSNKNDDLNLIFFRDIAKFDDADEYIKIVNNKYFNMRPNTSKLEKDLALEIIVNSKITVSKYGLFSLALKVELFGLVIMVFIFILCA